MAEPQIYFPFYVLCGADQGSYSKLPAYGRFKIWTPEPYDPDWYRGLPKLDGPHDLAFLDSCLWAVVELGGTDHFDVDYTEDGAEIAGLARFRTGFALFRGDRQTALEIFAAMTGRAAPSTPLLSRQDRTGVAIAPDNGVAIAGDEGFARAGRNGLAEAGAGGVLAGRPDEFDRGTRGVALAGYDGTAIVGVGGLALVDSGGRAQAGADGIAVARPGTGSTVEVGSGGVAVSLADKGIVKAGEKAVAVAREGGFMLEIGPRAIGVATRSVSRLVIDDGALVVHSAFTGRCAVRLGHTATLIFRDPELDNTFRILSTATGDLPPPGEYFYEWGSWRPSTDSDLRSWTPSSYQIEFAKAERAARYDAPAPPAPSFETRGPWWEAARDHDDEAEIHPEAVGDGAIVVLTSNIPAADLAAGRSDGRWWFGSPWGQRAGNLTEGVLCCLVRIEGETSAGEGDDDAVGFRNGTALYRGSLRGAVAALRAMGAEVAWGDRIALAGHGGVARVQAGRVMMSVYPEHGSEPVEDTSRPDHLYSNPVVLRYDPSVERFPSLAVAGDDGFAIADSEAHAGRRGVACVSEGGIARTGAHGLALCERGLARAGERGVAWSRSAEYELHNFEFPSLRGEAVVGWGGVAVASLPGAAAISGPDGVAVAMTTGRARAGDDGIAIGSGSGMVEAHGGRNALVIARQGRVRGGDGALLVAWDKGTGRWIHATVGQNGIEPGVRYVASNGRLEPWQTIVSVKKRSKSRPRS